MTTTKVILEGQMGRDLGREWEFENLRSARHAISMIDANTGKALRWIRDNLEKYANYRVVCEYDDGRKEELENISYAEMNQRGASVMRFVPMVSGASGVARVVVGVVMVVAGAVFQQPWAIKLGAAIALGGVAQLLAPKPNMQQRQEEQEGKASYYFNGAVNVTTQGMPVQLIYGRCRVGSQAISAAITVDQLL